MWRLPFTSILMLILSNVVPAFAQFSAMATDYAGQRLFFSTELSQAGSGQPDYGKVFVADWRGVQLLLIYNYEAPAQGRDTWPFPGAFVTNFYNVDGVDLSSNGAYVSVMALRVCSGLTSGLCGYADQSTLYDNRGQVALTADGRLVLSPGGKWAFGIAGPLTGPYTEFTLYDLATGERYRYPLTQQLTTANRDWRVHDISDNGTALVVTGGGVILLRAPNFQQTLLIDEVGAATIDAAGSVAVWRRRSDSSVRAARLSDPSNPVYVGVSEGTEFQPRLSDDGSRVLLLSRPPGKEDPQLFTVTIGEAHRHQVTSEPEGIANAVLSGNGRVVWALTRTGRLVQVDLDSGRRTQYTQPLAAFLRPQYFSNSQAGPVLEGSPGEPFSLPASVMPGEKVAITMKDLAVPVVRLEPQTVFFQIPWTAPIGRTELTISKPDFPSWSGNKMQFRLSPLHPVLLAAAHQDFESPITFQQRARPGEIIHVYAKGFGPVTPAVPEGIPTPMSPLSRTVTPVVCAVSGYPADVWFAGLAPGLVGIYQFDIRLPNPLPHGGFVTLECRLAGSTWNAWLELSVQD